MFNFTSDKLEDIEDFKNVIENHRTYYKVQLENVSYDECNIMIKANKKENLYEKKNNMVNNNFNNDDSNIIVYQ